MLAISYPCTGLISVLLDRVISTYIVLLQPLVTFILRVQLGQ